MSSRAILALYANDSALAARFLYNNYRQALAIIRDYTPIIEQFKLVHKVTDQDIESWPAEELNYLQRLAKEPEEDVAKVTYFEALEGLKKARYVRHCDIDARYALIQRTYRQTFETVTQAAQFLNVNQSSFNTREQASHNKALARAKLGQVTKARNRLEVAEKAVEMVERTLEISEPWLEGSAEYEAAREYAHNRRFIRAVDELERLVVQRLFELSKANLAGTGNVDLSRSCDY